MVSERRAFGERLRLHREGCGISLESIAQRTKVPATLYEGLEHGDLSRWPPGIYGRAYVKAYAEAVGLNPADTVHEFTAVIDGNASPRGTGVAVAKREKAACLRLSMAEESTICPGIAKRMTLAGADLLIGFVIVIIAHTILGLGVWTTVSCVMVYYSAGRLVSDDPLFYWLYPRMRTRASSARTIPESPAEDVHVADAASTTA